MRNREVLEPGEDPNPLALHVRADVLDRQVEADIAVEIAIIRVARISFFRAPNLLRALHIAPERRHPGAAIDGRVHPEDGSRIGEQDAVRVDEEEANPLFAQELVDAGDVPALAEPDPLRAPPEEALVRRARSVHLRP